MGTYVMLTHLSHDGLRSPNAADYLNVFTAPDIEMAMKVAAIIRTFGHARTEIWGRNRVVDVR
jgi:hypothetical protein